MKNEIEYFEAIEGNLKAVKCIGYFGEIGRAHV